MKNFDYARPQTLYEGKRFNVVDIEVTHPNGVFHRQLVDHPGAVVILPLVDEEHIILIQNHRDIIQKTLWELPAGTLEVAEQPLECAYRELEEETGYAAKTVVPLLDIYSTPGFCNEILYGFVASELTYKGQNLDETETITSSILSFQEVKQMIKNKDICDAKTLCFLLYYFNASFI